jgi:hypothetical protein
MKLVIVVQRYGAEINGGSELHARYVAERLSAHADVRVLTTCARDYVTWRNEWAPGEERVNGIPSSDSLSLANATPSIFATGPRVSLANATRYTTNSAGSRARGQPARR